jgi:dTDP-4-amino-4,6-dideoxygalactose transaminase
MTRRYFDHEDLAMLKEVLDANVPSAIDGAWTRRLQKEFAAANESKYAVAVNSGMSALHACLAAAEASVGDEVICDPMVQFGAVACFYNNAVPVFADVQRDTHNIDPKSIRSRITERTRAILCTHLWGVPCDMDEIMAIAREHNLYVIEDNAHALFARYKGRMTGNLGHMAEFSFQAAKQLATGDGGMATTNDDRLHERLIAYSGVRGMATFPELMWNYRMSELVAAVALVQLRRARKYVEEGIAAGRIYSQAVADIPWIRPQYTSPDRTNVYHLWAATFEGDKHGIARDDFARELSAVKMKGSFGLGYIQKPAYLHDVIRKPLAYKHGCPTHPPYYTGDAARYEPGLCPVAEDLMPRLMLISTVGSPDEHRRNAELLRQACLNAQRSC